MSRHNHHTVTIFVHLILCPHCPDLCELYQTLRPFVLFLFVWLRSVEVHLLPLTMESQEVEATLAQEINKMIHPELPFVLKTFTGTVYYATTHEILFLERGRYWHFSRH